MDRIYKLNAKVVVVIFAILDVLCVGMGMGVPIFCILFGFPVGWYIARRVTVATKVAKDVLKETLVYATVTAAFTFVLMSVLWGITIHMLFDPHADFENFGIPMILYDPKISFIGWLVLMILISPFLQLLTTVFASHVALLSWPKNGSSAG